MAETLSGTGVPASEFVGPWEHKAIDLAPSAAETLRGLDPERRSAVEKALLELGPTMGHFTEDPGASIPLGFPGMRALVRGDCQLVYEPRRRLIQALILVTPGEAVPAKKEFTDMRARMEAMLRGES